MGEGSLRKDFVLPPGDWTDDHAQTIEEFFQEVIARHLAVKTGSYRGSGRVQTIAVKDLPGPPKLLAIQPSLGGTVVFTLVATPSGSITGWNHKGFTLSTAAGVNTQNVDYRFLILA